MSNDRPAVPSQDGGLFRVRMDLSYDGASFYGWAAQDDLPTVQGSLEAALEVLIRRPVRVTVAVTAQGHHLERFVGTFVALGFADAFDFQAVGDVVEDVHVWE